MKPGKSLEKLILWIEKALANNLSTKFEPNKRLRDRITGRLREHDVVITFTEGHYLFLTAVECKDRSRRVTVDQVESFGAKCSDTGINLGIIVSSSGFCNSARKKASHLGIRCLDIEEIKQFDWLNSPFITSTTVKLLRNDWIFYPEIDGIVEKCNFEIIDKDGNLINNASLTANAQEHLSKILPKNPDAVENKEITIKISNSGLILKNNVKGITIPVKLAVVKILFSITKEIVPFNLVQYKEKSKDNIITDAAYADINVGKQSARILIVYDENKGGQLMFGPHSKEK